MDYLEEEEYSKVMAYFLPFIVAMIYWLLCNRLRPRLAVFYPFVCIFLQILVVTLGFWGYMPDWLMKVDAYFQEDIIQMSIVYFIMMNYSSFVETLVLTPLVFTVPYYF
jgi:hypothetical protein